MFIKNVIESLFIAAKWYEIPYPTVRGLLSEMALTDTSALAAKLAG